MAVYGDTITVNNYKANNTGISCEIDGEEVLVTTSYLEAREQITFTGILKIISNDPNIRCDIIFIAPKIIISSSSIGIRNNGYNTLTIRTETLNMDNAVYSSVVDYPGPLNIYGMSEITATPNLQLTSSSNGKTLLEASTLTGTIGLVFDDTVSIGDDITFYVDYTVANNLVISESTGYSVTKTSTTGRDTYVVRRLAETKYVKSLNVGSVSYKVKDEEARASLANKIDKNTAITAGTNTKITYDANGLVTGGANLSATDIPDLSATYYLASNPSGYQTSSQVSTAITGSIVNVVTSSSTTTSLSANMGKALQDQITNLKGIGRFLALWNCATGLAESNPTTSPRTYNTGDYFVVSTVAGSGGTNYRPDGTQYVIGQASTTVETSSVAENDVYFYDGTNWTLQNNHGGLATVSFSNITGQPTDNTNLAIALSAKADSDDLGALAYADMITSGDIDGTIPYAKLSGVATSAQGALADSALQNTATGTNSLTILGNICSSSQGINVGVGSTARSSSTVIGYNAAAYNASIVIGWGATDVSSGNGYNIVIGYDANAVGNVCHSIAIGEYAEVDSNSSDAFYQIALGYYATAKAQYAIQLGGGTNSTANTFQVWNYTILNKTTGKIPNDRLTISTSMSSSSTDSEIPSAKLLYDTVGNIETLLAAI